MELQIPKWKEMLKQDEHLWRVSKWERLCTGCDRLSSAEKVTQTSTLTNTPKTYYERFKFYIMLPLPQICAKECSKGLQLGQRLLDVVSTLLQFCGILAIRETRRVTDYCGTVNVLDVADTD